MIEQYLKDSIPEPDRQARVEAISKMDLMPARILDAIRLRDSIRQAKALKLEKELMKKAKDTMDIRYEDDSELPDAPQKPEKEKESVPIKNVKDTVGFNAIIADKIKLPLQAISKS